MASVYDKPEIYDLIEDENRYNIMKKHWEAIVEGRQITTLLDVSIGSGSLTLPLAELGIRLYGSDLSRPMLERCGQKAADKKIEIELRWCDFRNVSKRFTERFDCVASTGNSLPHVDNADVLTTLEEMDALVRPGGYLYFDIRNWDKIMREKNRFYLYNPFFKGDMRINLMQVWDYHADQSMTFNILYTFEKENKIVQKEKFEEHYIPIRKEKMIAKIREMGYKEIETRSFPAFVPNANVDKADWYCVIAKKAEA